MQKKWEHHIGTIFTELRNLYAQMDDSNLDRLLDGIEESERIYLVGAGRSGLILRAFAMRLMHLGKNGFVVGDTMTPGARVGDLLIMVSGSGETGSLVHILRKADSLGLRKALITARPDSTLASLADIVVPLPAPTPKVDEDQTAVSDQPMGNLFEQAAFLLLEAVVMELMDRKGMDSEAMFTRHANLE